MESEADMATEMESIGGDGKGEPKELRDKLDIAFLEFV